MQPVSCFHRREAGRADALDEGCGGVVWMAEAGDSEVDEPDAAGVIEHDVARLEIADEDRRIVLVQDGQDLADLVDPPEHLVHARIEPSLSTTIPTGAPQPINRRGAPRRNGLREGRVAGDRIPRAQGVDKNCDPLVGQRDIAEGTEPDDVVDHRVGK